jgi:phytanoyl-CoA hydroxylase
MDSFSDDQLPWIDRADADIDAFLSRSAPRASELRDALIAWRAQGYVVLKRAAADELCDAYLEDVGRLIEEHQDHDVRVACSTHGSASIQSLTLEEIQQPQLRLENFHNASTAGKQLGLAAPIVDFVGAIFDDTPVMAQSLTFLRGSQQLVHQDHAFVTPVIPGYLAAAWIALEEIHPDSGPVFYYPESHRIPKFDFGNGPFMTPDSQHNESDVAAYIEAECTKRGSPRVELLVEKGDILLWHCSLAHGGAAVRNPALTRKSVVFHYSTEQGCPADRRDPAVAPKRFCMNGGFCYEDPTHPELENRFQSAGPV